MAKRLQIMGKFPSESTLDEEAVVEIVDDYLTEKPLITAITITEIGSSDPGGDPDTPDDDIPTVAGGPVVHF